MDLKNPGVDSRRRLAVNTDSFPASPAAKSSSNIMPFIPLELVGTAEIWSVYVGWVGCLYCSLDSARPLYTIVQAWALVRSFEFQHQITES